MGIILKAQVEISYPFAHKKAMWVNEKVKCGSWNYRNSVRNIAIPLLLRETLLNDFIF